MIDTIVLRLHDIKKYNLLIERLKIKKNKGFSVKTATVDADEAQRLRSSGRKSKEIFQIMEINRTGEFLARTEVAKQVNSSGHYAFAYRIDYHNDYLEFNFSVPKYIFGSNVIQFIEHRHDVHYQTTRNDSLDYNIKHTIFTFHSFITNFLACEFPLDPIDLKDLEVNRLDVCYNLVFKSKDEALVYFNYIKKLNKKYAREEDGGQTDWNTSFMYKTSRSSSKVYHKGAEYKKHDLKQHLKINDEKGFEYFNTVNFQNLADKILRYEVTIRSAELNYLFKRKIFRKDCPTYQTLLRNYLRIENTIKRNERIAKKLGELDESQRKAYRESHPYEKIGSEDRQTHKFVSQLINRKPYFMMEIGEIDTIYNKTTVNFQSSQAKFSKMLLALCFEKLIRFINEFKIKELPGEEEVSLLIDQYNATHKTKLLKSSMIQFYMLLVQHGSFKEAAKFARKDKSTMHRYKQRFKKIGITGNDVHPDKNFSFPQPAFDFKEYHSFLLRYPLLKTIKIRRL